MAFLLSEGGEEKKSRIHQSFFILLAKGGNSIQRGLKPE